MFGVQRHITQLPTVSAGGLTATLQTSGQQTFDLNAGNYWSVRSIDTVMWSDVITDPGGLTTVNGSGYRVLPAGSYTFTFSGNFLARNSFSSGYVQLRAAFVQGGSAGTQIWQSPLRTGPSQAFAASAITYTSASSFTISPVIYNASGNIEWPGMNNVVLVITQS